MGRKAVFLDVDGTFVNDRGVVPPSARKAVVAARANGHEVFLCTGLSMAELRGEIVEPGFDGVIASAVLGTSLRLPAPHHSDGVPEAASRAPRRRESRWLGDQLTTNKPPSASGTTQQSPTSYSASDLHVHRRPTVINDLKINSQDSTVGAVSKATGPHRRESLP
ncbi:haloacid dehalogenase-like hydrolase [Geodermatophilus africanus]|uniref:Haloacid dehalogenase-like hydrolase n=1 Tax=Geodermatophilus africanus TaxID=1137993 RepID=A0A1H3DLC2_9ACTN|nr:HAD hydrolase family protein [Geodermatophilus africanus]SDX67312.1 haloacid dehalogenase-like hydrolase [Geodermatophilus africanus]